MDDKGQTERIGELQLLAERPLLRCFVGIVVVVVKPDLPDGDPLGRGEEGGDALKVPFAEVREVGGVKARRKEQRGGICAVFRVIVRFSALSCSAISAASAEES